MLSSILHTEIAEEVSIRIMRSFVKMRKCFAINEFDVEGYLNGLLNILD